jgi:hypothetical protein
MACLEALIPSLRIPLTGIRGAVPGQGTKDRMPLGGKSAFRRIGSGASRAAQTADVIVSGLQDACNRVQVQRQPDAQESSPEARYAFLHR